jgi:hypothetical protein
MPLRRRRDGTRFNSTEPLGWLNGMADRLGGDPLASDLHIRLVHLPAVTDPVPAGPSGQKRREALHPPVYVAWSTSTRRSMSNSSTSRTTARSASTSGQQRR